MPRVQAQPRPMQTILTTNAYDIVGLEHQYYAGKIEPIMTRLLENGDLVTIREAENYRLKPKPAPITIEPAAPALVVEPETADTPKENTGVAEHEQLMFDFEFDEPVNPTELKTADVSEEQSCCEKLPNGGIVIHVPSYDDGLDDNEGDIKL